MGGTEVTNRPTSAKQNATKVDALAAVQHILGQAPLRPVVPHEVTTSVQSDDDSEARAQEKHLNHQNR